MEWFSSSFRKTLAKFLEFVKFIKKRVGRGKTFGTLGGGKKLTPGECTIMCAKACGKAKTV